MLCRSLLRAELLPQALLRLQALLPQAEALLPSDVLRPELLPALVLRSGPELRLRRVVGAIKNRALPPERIPLAAGEEPAAFFFAPRAATCLANADLGSATRGGAEPCPDYGPGAGTWPLIPHGLGGICAWP